LGWDLGWSRENGRRRAEIFREKFKAFPEYASNESGLRVVRKMRWFTMIANPFQGLYFVLI